MEGSNGDTDTDNRLIDMEEQEKVRVGQMEKVARKHTSTCVCASLIAQLAKNPPAMQEILV